MKTLEDFKARHKELKSADKTLRDDYREASGYPLVSNPSARALFKPRFDSLKLQWEEFKEAIESFSKSLIESINPDPALPQQLFILERKAEKHDEMRGIIIRARTEAEARAIASDSARDEGRITWLDSELSTCKPLTYEGETGFVLSDVLDG
jgi:hypothetical protein